MDQNQEDDILPIKAEGVRDFDPQKPITFSLAGNGSHVLALLILLSLVVAKIHELEPSPHAHRPLTDYIDVLGGNGITGVIAVLISFGVSLEETRSSIIKMGRIQYIPWFRKPLPYNSSTRRDQQLQTKIKKMVDRLPDHFKNLDRPDTSPRLSALKPNGCQATVHFAVPGEDPRSHIRKSSQTFTPYHDTSDELNVFDAIYKSMMADKTPLFLHHDPTYDHLADTRALCNAKGNMDNVPAKANNDYSGFGALVIAGPVLPKENRMHQLKNIVSKNAMGFFNFQIPKLIRLKKNDFSARNIKKVEKCAMDYYTKYKEDEIERLARDLITARKHRDNVAADRGEQSLSSIQRGKQREKRRSDGSLSDKDHFSGLYVYTVTNPDPKRLSDEPTIPGETMAGPSSSSVCNIQAFATEQVSARESGRIRTSARHYPVAFSYIPEENSDEDKWSDEKSHLLASCSASHRS